MGASGVLGGEILKVFSKSPNYRLSASFRGGRNEKMERNHPGVEFISLGVEQIVQNPSSFDFRKYDVVLNCIGAIKQRGFDESEMFRINSIFPRIIARGIKNSSTRLIHFTTDCVFAGAYVAIYNEQKEHDAMDAYGLSKSLGESEQQNVYNLRASFVGEEKQSSYSLLGWFKSQPLNGTISGFSNQFWNGIGSVQYSKIVNTIIREDFFNVPNLMHILPKNYVSKYELLNLFRKYYARDDLSIEYRESANFVYRVLCTSYPTTNLELWSRAGYSSIPTIEDMVREQAEAALER